jgi:hypothetical protein
MDLALSAANENGLIEPNKIKMLNEIWSSLNLQHGVMGVIGEVGKPLEAAVLMRTEPMWYSDKMCLIERAVFVRPEFRSAKGGRASRLCDFAKKTADELKIPLVIGILSTHQTEAKVRLYRRKFGEPSGGYWIYNGGTGSDSWAV